MFNRKLNSDAFSNLIAEGTIIEGNVSFTGVIKIQGVVRGEQVIGATDPADKKPLDCIVVDTNGHVTSTEITATNMIISGVVSSKKIWAENTLRILKTARVNGAVIYYRTLEMEPGAVLHECQLKHLDHASEGEKV